MDFCKVSVISLIVASFLSFGPRGAEAEDGNAIGGSARSADTDAPLEDVDVSVVKQAGVRDQTRAPDGLYTLKVPASLKAFDLLYKKAGYLDSYDPEVLNDKQQQKRPIARMTPVSSISKLGSNILVKLVNDAIAAMKRGAAMRADSLTESGAANLKVLEKNLPPRPELLGLKERIREALQTEA
ncbi:MAG: hypothetical protein LAO04_20125 [Acidobacteriia bacterium]|nr:hypothetical protein [Terriglobia bacterium]